MSNLIHYKSLKRSDYHKFLLDNTHYSYTNHSKLTMRSAWKQVNKRRGSQDIVTQKDATPASRNRSISEGGSTTKVFRMQQSATGKFLRKLRRKSRPSALQYNMLANDDDNDRDEPLTEDGGVQLPGSSPSSVYSTDCQVPEIAISPTNVSDKKDERALTFTNDASKLGENETVRPTSSSSSPSWVRLQKRHLTEHVDDPLMPVHHHVDAGNPWIDSSPKSVILDRPLTSRLPNLHFTESGLHDVWRRESSPDNQLAATSTTVGSNPDSRPTVINEPSNQTIVFQAGIPTICCHGPGFHPPTPTPWFANQSRPDHAQSGAFQREGRSIALAPIPGTPPQQPGQLVPPQATIPRKSVVSRSSANTSVRASNSFALRRMSQMSIAEKISVAQEQSLAQVAGNADVRCSFSAAGRTESGAGLGTAVSLVHRNVVLNEALEGRDRQHATGQWEHNLW